MIKYSEILTLDILLKGNEQVTYDIEDIIFSKHFKNVLGLVIKTNRLYKSKSFIPFKNIKDIKETSIIITDNEVLKSGRKYNQKYSDIVDRKVITKRFKCLGYVKDVAIRKEDGKVVGFIISEGLIEDLMSGRKFLPVSNIAKINKEYFMIKNLKKLESITKTSKK